jgi:hypothetical protein
MVDLKNLSLERWLRKSEIRKRLASVVVGRVPLFLARGQEWEKPNRILTASEITHMRMLTHLCIERNTSCGRNKNGSRDDTDKYL